jgi:hypothetical protein
MTTALLAGFAASVVGISRRATSMTSARDAMTSAWSTRRRRPPRSTRRGALVIAHEARRSANRRKTNGARTMRSAMSMTSSRESAHDAVDPRIDARRESMQDEWGANVAVGDVDDELTRKRAKTQSLLRIA